MDRIVLLEYVAPADDVYNRRLACEELSSTSQASRRSMPGIDYDSAYDYDYDSDYDPGHAGGYVPGMSVAYENKA